MIPALKFSSHLLHQGRGQYNPPSPPPPLQERGDMGEAQEGKRSFGLAPVKFPSKTLSCLIHGLVTLPRCRLGASSWLPPVWLFTNSSVNPASCQGHGAEKAPHPRPLSPEAAHVPHSCTRASHNLTRQRQPLANLANHSARLVPTKQRCKTHKLQEGRNTAERWDKKTQAGIYLGDPHTGFKLPAPFGHRDQGLRQCQRPYKPQIIQRGALPPCLLLPPLPYR